MESAKVRVDRTPLAAVLAIAAVAVVQVLHYYPRLPATLAVHFNAAGAPNGWSSKPAFIVAYCGIEAALAVFAFVLAFIGERLPAGALNIPNRAYWLSQERRDATLTFVWSRVLWLEVTTLAFLVAVAEIIFRINVSASPPSLPSSFLAVLIAFVFAVGWQAVSIVVRFSRRDPLISSR